MDRLSLVLNLQKAKPTLGPGEEAKTISLDVPRPERTWQLVLFARLREWAASTPVEEGKLMVFPGVDVLGIPYWFDWLRHHTCWWAERLVAARASACIRSFCHLFYASRLRYSNLH